MTTGPAPAFVLALRGDPEVPASVPPRVPGLSKSAWTVLAGDALSAVGTGLTLPFLFVYLHRVRGIGVAPAELALSTFAVASVFGNVVGGWLSDRISARNSLVVGLSLAAVGSLALTLVRRPVDAFAAVVSRALHAARHPNRGPARRKAAKHDLPNRAVSIRRPASTRERHPGCWPPAPTSSRRNGY